MPPVRVRAMRDDERDRIGGLAAADPVCWVSAEVFGRELEAGRFRNEWTWIAEDRGRVRARAVWWGRADGALSLALDCVWVDASVDDPVALARVVVGAGLDALRTAGVGEAPRFELRLPASWRADPRLVSGVDWRRRLAATVGLGDELERLQLEWVAGTPVPPPSGRLRFSPADDDAFLDVFRRVAAGSLDVATRRAVGADGDEAAARDDLRFYRAAPGDRAWWRVAHDADGAVAGFVIPSATEAGPNVGYLGVVPEARGRRHVDDLLAAATRFHASRGAERISATTDATNLPMAAAFSRHGYRVSEHRLVFSAARALRRPAAKGGRGGGARSGGAGGRPTGGALPRREGRSAPEAQSIVRAALAPVAFGCVGSTVGVSSRVLETLRAAARVAGTVTGISAIRVVLEKATR